MSAQAGVVATVTNLCPLSTFALDLFIAGNISKHDLMLKTGRVNLQYRSYRNHSIVCFR